MRSVLRCLPSKGKQLSPVALAALDAIPQVPGDHGYADGCVFTVTGILCEPRVSHRKGNMMWQCTLSQTHQGISCREGKSITDRITVDTQIMDIRCAGSVFEEVRGLAPGQRLVCVGKLFHRPRFVATTASYDYKPEIVVDDTFGFVRSL